MTRPVLLLVLLLVVVAAAGAWRQGWLAATPAPPPVQPTRTPPPRFQSEWATEQKWLVDRIKRDIREMAALAAGRTTSPGDAQPAKSEPIPVVEHLFAPRTFEPFAREALAGVDASGSRPASGSGEDAALLTALLDPQASVLVREDQALSRRIEADPRDKGAHERAGLLLGAFALTDCAGIFTDIRPALTRITAHLALARALPGGQEPGLAGRYAEAVLVTLVGRERDALARLDSLAAGAKTPAETAWLRALRLRNTGDWRIAQNEKRLTLLESLEEFRALAWGQDDQAAVAWLEPRKPPMIADWGRIAQSVNVYSVETSNRFADMSMAMDLAQTMEVLTRLRGAPADEAAFLAALDERPQGGVHRDADGKQHVAVLGWGLWAYRWHRNLIHDVASGAAQRWMTGQHGEYKAYADHARVRFGRLSMFPLALRSFAGEDPEAYRKAMAAVRELALHSPELVTGANWEEIRRPKPFAPVPRDLPDQNAWFHPALPAGTLLEVGPRLRLAQELIPSGAEELRALREQAPHDADLALFVADRLPVEQRSATDLAAVYGPLVEINVPAMGALAQAAWYDPPDFRKRQRALCEISGEYCLTLGYRLAELGFPDEAAPAYQEGFDRTRDRVTAANKSRWLVDYYFDHGQLRKAEAVAREAASVYSAQGLFVMARLMERMGRLREAEEHYRRIQERYNNGAELVGFYYRRARVDKDASYETRLRDALALALPPGLEPFDRASLPASPKDGVVVKSVNDNTKRFGIMWGNVIVAADGFRVHDYDAYNLVRALSQSPKMKLVVWRGASYDEIDVELWDRLFRIDMDTFKQAG